MFLDSASIHPYGSFWLDFADKAIKGLAVIVAGLWTYSNAVRSGAFKRKLEPNISGVLFEVSGQHFLKVEARLKNVGLTNYPIRQRGTAVEVIPLRSSGREPPIISSVFKNHGWIQPGEEIGEPLIFPIEDPRGFVAFEINLRVVSEGELDWVAIEWNAKSVVSHHFAENCSDSRSTTVPAVPNR
jgi:hypothetical protein